MDSKFSSGGSIGANSRHDKNYNIKERPLDRYFTTTCGIMKEFKSRRAFTFRGSAGGGSFRPRSHNHGNSSSVQKSNEGTIDKIKLKKTKLSSSSYHKSHQEKADSSNIEPNSKLNLWSTRINLGEIKDNRKNRPLSQKVNTRSQNL